MECGNPPAGSSFDKGSVTHSRQIAKLSANMPANLESGVGSFREEIIVGETGFLSRSCEPADLANALEVCFQSDLYKGLDSHRPEIRDYAYAQHSSDAVAKLTRTAYEGLVKRRRP